MAQVQFYSNEKEGGKYFSHAEGGGGGGYRQSFGVVLAILKWAQKVGTL